MKFSELFKNSRTISNRICSASRTPLFFLTLLFCSLSLSFSLDDQKYDPTPKVVLLTSFADTAVDVDIFSWKFRVNGNLNKSLHEAFKKSFKNSSYEVVVKENASLFDLHRYLMDETVIGLFWVSHGSKRTKIDGTPLVAEDMIIAQNGGIANPVFQKFNKNLKYLAVIGCDTKNYFEKTLKLSDRIAVKTFAGKVYLPIEALQESVWDSIPHLGINSQSNLNSLREKHGVFPKIKGSFTSQDLHSSTLDDLLMINSNVYGEKFDFNEFFLLDIYRSRNSEERQSIAGELVISLNGHFIGVLPSFRQKEFSHLDKLNLNAPDTVFNYKYKVPKHFLKTGPNFIEADASLNSKPESRYALTDIVIEHLGILNEYQSEDWPVSKSALTGKPEGIFKRVFFMNLKEF